jgi:hypothetical protein
MLKGPTPGERAPPRWEVLPKRLDGLWPKGRGMPPSQGRALCYLRRLGLGRPAWVVGRQLQRRYHFAAPTVVLWARLTIK